MKSMYDDALYLQSAVNPGPILRRFLEMIQEIKDEATAERGGWSTDDITHHPCFVLLADKVQDMAGHGYRYSNAYDECIRKATPETLKLMGLEPREGAA